MEIVSDNQYEMINAIKTCLELDTNILTISTVLKPIDENQKYDADLIFDNNGFITSVIFHNKYIMGISTRILDRL